MTPANDPLTARRNVPFVETRTFTIDDAGTAFNLSGYTAALQVRMYGAAGATIISLPSVGADGEGVWVYSPATGELQIKINQPTLQTAYDASIGSNEPGSDLLFIYDLVLTSGDGLSQTWLEGDFTIKPGVTEI